MDDEVKVAVADDQELVRIGVKAGLEHINNIAVVAVEPAQDDVLRLVGRYRPNVLVLGISMSSDQGSESTLSHVCAIIRKVVNSYDTSILIMSNHDHRGLVRTLLDAGASGFLQRDEALASCEELAKIIVTRASIPAGPKIDAGYFFRDETEAEPDLEASAEDHRRELAETIAMRARDLGPAGMEALDTMLQSIKQVRQRTGQTQEGSGQKES